MKLGEGLPAMIQSDDSIISQVYALDSMLVMVLRFLKCRTDQIYHFYITNKSLHHPYIHKLLTNASLVGGFNSSEKYESIGMIIPNIWKHKFHVPVTTNQF